MAGEMLVISNYWHKPGIKISVLHHKDDAPAGSIHMETALADYLAAVIQEMRSPALIMTRAAMSEALQQASTAALEKIKHSSTAAMAKVGT